MNNVPIALLPLQGPADHCQFFGAAVATKATARNEEWWRTASVPRLRRTAAAPSPPIATGRLALTSPRGAGPDAALTPPRGAAPDAPYQSRRGGRGPRKRQERNSATATAQAVCYHLAALLAFGFRFLRWEITGIHGGATLA